MKTRLFAATCISISLVLFSCKHEILNPELEISLGDDNHRHAHLEGNFYVESTYDYSYSQVFYQITETSYDQVINLSIINDSLCFKEYKIPIDSVSQTKFVLHSEEYPDEIEIEYSNDFNVIEINFDFFDNDSGPHAFQEIFGYRAELAETSIDNFDFTQHNGNYLLTREYWHSSIGEWEVSTDTFYVERTNSNINIGTDSFEEFTLFHSHFQKFNETNSTFDTTSYYIEVQLADSFIFKLDCVTEDEDYYFIDSVSYRYSGVPL